MNTCVVEHDRKITKLRGWDIKLNCLCHVRNDNVHRGNVQDIELNQQV